RPGRWSEAMLREEHAFALELAAAEIPVVPPLEDLCGETLHAHEGFFFALYPRQGGRAPELESEETLTWMGRFIGRLHAVGATRPFHHRPALDVASFGEAPCRFLLERGFVPTELREAY
ncbi:phosphotransferase, partial [Pelomicrobium sp. G1]|uniref:phosphotransferase n=1 Tax=Pelomicrobium sp. G1 TaxID=3452920 RepID=UPI003F75AD18